MDTTTTVEHLGVEIISPSPWQTRRFPRKDPELRALAESIGAVGVLQPILVRPIDDGRFELLAGERRLRASIKANLPNIPAIVRDVDDDVAAEICVTENLQREDLSVVEEGHAIALLLERDAWTIEAVADQIGRSPSWVARRSSLWTRLAPEWKKAAADPDHPAHGWPATRLEIVARVETASQAAILKKHDGRQGWFWHGGSEEVQREVDLWMHVLKTSPFDTKDVDLYADAGACVVCPHRASTAHLLFDDVEPGEGVPIPKGDRCLRPTCWKKKTMAHFVATFDAAKEKNGKAPILIVGYSSDAVVKALGAGKTLQRWEIGPAKARPFKGSMPVLMCDPHGKQYGRLMNAKKTSRQASAQTRTTTLEEKREQLAVKRSKDAAAAIMGAIRTSGKTPKPKVIWALHALFDLSRGQVHNDAEDVDIVAELKTATADAAGMNALAARLWSDSTLEDIEGSTSWFWHAKQGDDAVASLVAVAEHVGVDAAPLVAEAIASNPEPASWSKKKTKKKTAKKKTTTKKAAKKITKKRATKKADPIDAVADAADALGLDESDLRHAVDVVGAKRTTKEVSS